MNETMKIIFGLVGGLAIFIYGMNMMSECLQKAAGEKMKKILALLTKNPILGVLAGALTTAVLQSSSATTVMTIGFVSAGLMSLPQAISIILGANIGTTMTAQIIAFKITDYIYLFIFVGFLLSFISKKEKVKNIGQTIFAFGLLFLGIETMGDVMKPLASSAFFVNMIGKVSHIPILGVCVGAVMTLVVQSSSATIAVLQNFASQAGPDGVTSIIGLAVKRLKELAQTMLASTGYEEISLSSLSSSDYSDLEELINFLIEECDKKHVNISLPSLRIDAFSLDIMQKVQDIKKSSLTFAPEAGSQRLRNVINKGLTVDNILTGSHDAFVGGWNKVKLYFMLGLPTETEEDMRAIPELANEIAALYYDTVPKEQRNGKCQITISTSFFVPKPFTPFQWATMLDPSDYLARAKIVNDHVKEQLNHKSIRYNWHEADVTVLEGILARGDRKISKAILYVYEHGGFFDAWSEFFHYDLWLEAFAACGIDIDFYTKRARSDDEIFPWDFIDVGVTKAFMLREWKTALSETVTPNCRMRCSGCGARQFGGGVCFENQN